MTPERRALPCVLLVEDNPGDIRLVRMALESSGVEYRLDVVSDGDEAIEYLREAGSSPDAARPELVLLDLNLPGTRGTAVLAAMKANGHLRSIPVVVLTSSDREEEIREVYGGGASAYVSKPSDVERYLHVVRRLAQIWLGPADAAI